MKHLFILSALLLALGCNNKKQSKVNKEATKNIGTIVLVLAKANPEYSKEETLQLSRAIDPMVDKFEGYFGRKMIFGTKNPDLMGDIVYYENVQAFEKASEIEMKSETCQKFFATMLPDPEADKMLIATPEFITPTKVEKVTTVEIVLFKIKPEYTKSEVIRAAKAINPILDELDGFISRSLSITEDGQWIDILYWNSMENAEAALQKVINNETCQQFFAMTDDTTSELLHFEVAIDTER